MIKHILYGEPTENWDLRSGETLGILPLVTNNPHQENVMTATATLTAADAIRIGRDTLNVHGLSMWDFKLNNSKRNLGVCKYPYFNTRKWMRIEGRIEISVYCVKSGMDSFMDTLLHEVAHAIVGHEAGHGPVWKQKARELGCKGDRCGKFEVDVPAKYVGTCPQCGFKFKQHRELKHMGMRVHTPCRVFKKYIVWEQMY